MAEVAEKELGEFVENTPSYLKDTTDFLSKLQNIQQPLPEGAIMFCMDVCKLYPSIPSEEGLKACRKGLGMRTDHSLPTEGVMQMIELVLKNNNFEFNGNHYLQTEGTAIGSKLGRNYACAYMRMWDEELLETTGDKPLVYYRFVDDVFGIWTQGIDKLREFHAMANDIHPSIQLDLRWSYTSMEFLDTQVKLQGGFVRTDVYIKPTDKRMYLHYRSDHPAHTKKSPYGQGARIKRICSDDVDYKRQRNILKQGLRRRGYSGRFVESQLSRVDSLDRNNLMTYKQRGRKKMDRVPLVITYSANIPNINAILRKRLQLLHRSSRMQKVFGEPPMAAYRRNSNIGDVLVHGKTKRIVSESMTPGFEPCRGRCTVCTRCITSTSVSSTEGQLYKIRDSITCETANVIYAVYCDRCATTVCRGDRATLKETGDRPPIHHPYRQRHNCISPL